MKHVNKAILLSFLLILLAACDGLQDIGLAPQIASFTATPDEIEAGESSTLSWNVIGGAEDLAVTLEPGNVELDATGEYDVSPSETTVYILSATSGDKTASEELTVSVSGGEEPSETPDEPEEEPGEEPEEEPGEEPEEPEENVLEGDIVVTNQAELDALAGVTNIEGFLSLSTEAETLDFSPLNSLKTVTRSLGLSNNPNLTTIEGFPSLISVGADEFLGEGASLRISGNSNLTELKGFEALQTAKQLEISDNDSLQSFSGFSALQEAAITISENASLKALPEFESLVSTDITRPGFAGGLSIRDNPKLTTLDTFSKLERSSGFSIVSNDALASITGFESLLQVNPGAEGNDELALVINDNPNLTEISGFENATGISGFWIIGNPSLKTVSGFSKMTDGSNGRQGFRISDSPELEEISGFDALETAAPELNISNLPKLVSIPSFSNLNTISIFQVKISNTGLTSIDGFNGATRVNGLRITENSALTKINGFSSLAEVADGLNIASNPVLTQISGFDALSDGSNASISDNTSFDCSTDPQASLPFLPIETSTGNLVNCPTAE